jgi:hypothetical protein
VSAPPGPLVEAPLAKLRRMQALRHRLRRLEQDERARYRTDPAGWARDRLGVHLWSKQREIAESVVRNPRTTVRSAHTTGKSFNASLLAAFWIDVHPPGEALVVTTAPTYDQVHGVIWEEIRKHHRTGKLPGRVMANDRWLLDDGREVGIGRKPPDHRRSAFQGWHRKYVLVILDEAGGVPAWLWDAAETITTGDHCRILAIGNPDDRSSHFYKTHTTDPGWHRIKVSAFDTPAFTGEPCPGELLDVLVRPGWVADKQLRWGETNPLYVAKVTGEFADAEDGLIPLHWVIAAQRRWHDWQERLRQSPTRLEPAGRRVFGVDPAWLGEDKTAIATRQGPVVLDVEAHAKEDTTQTAGRVQAKLRGHPQSLAVVDVVGVGAGVVDMLGRSGQAVVPFNGSSPTRRRDSTGSWRFSNMRTASWYNLREMLDPSMDAQLALPPDDDLTADLTTPKYEPRAGGIIHVESKDELRKRLGHSPDRGDAVVLATWAETPDRDTADTPTPVTYSDSPSHRGDVIVDDWGDPDGWL